ncbi:hypothetical protein BCR33DRAFT_693220 [Rhizoclosmatium globosum]|uniref:Velvet domain-containing protein n=1 Tax=Rhizoclosmatium globosum TaxID=329046 RepID=A0A1Y2D3D8_9FUNG|nr:hypothetical protein BCR33DRAFT_693220 [Rhizoclosmatium globosum]|eukprot:ORY53792.1 hypothetical protein BCR33DRAFT_693220 [Rhizoclosmatium globosum]
MSQPLRRSRVPSEASEFSTDHANQPAPPANPQAPQISLEIVQNPIRTRVCGFSIHDRRPIMPPPIIKVHGIDDADAASYVMFASLWSTDGDFNLSLSQKSGPSHMYKPYEPTEEDEDLLEGQKPPLYRVVVTDSYSKSMILMGPLIAVSRNLLDLERKPGTFFVYNDLSVRSSGHYRLKFELFKLSTGGKEAPAAIVFSDIFQVFSPKDYPAVPDTTELSRCFARQGVDIRMKYALDSL